MRDLSRIRATAAIALAAALTSPCAALGATNTQPMYRLYNPNGGDHHYTLSAGERDLLVAVGWKAETRSLWGTRRRSPLPLRPPT